MLARSPFTISREVRRNSGGRDYRPNTYSPNCLKGFLRQAISALPQGSGYRHILLTNVPNGLRIFGFLRFKAILVLDGVECIALGVQTPLHEIAHAARAHSVDIVALSFFAALPRAVFLDYSNNYAQYCRKNSPLSWWTGHRSFGIVGMVYGKKSINSIT